MNLLEYLKFRKLPKHRNPEDYSEYAKQFILKENRIFKGNRQLLPRYDMEKYLAIFHDHPTGAHFSAETIYDKMRSRYIWTTMRKDIEEYCKSCDDCQRRGPPKRNNFLHPIELSSPFDHWGIDLVGPLPSTAKRNRYIIVATDYFTRWPEARPLKRADAQSVADFIYDEIICRFRPPSVIQSD